MRSIDPYSLAHLKLFYRHNKDASRKVSDIIYRIVLKLLEYYDDIISILLFGSIARGEGIWKRGNDNTIKIISDLDLLVITNKTRTYSKEFKRFMNELESYENISIDIKFLRFKTLRNSNLDTHTFDKKDSLIIWGLDLSSYFPEVKKEDIKIDDMIFLFFNRIILTLEKFPILELKNLSPGAKEWLSHEASKTMFTCADLVSIYFGNYTSSVIEKVKFTRKQSEKLRIPNKNKFLKDMEKAFNFRFKNIDVNYFDDPFHFWLSARDHLLTIFKHLYEKSAGELYGERVEDFFISSLITFFNENEQNIKDIIFSLFKLLSIKKLPRFSNHEFNCRMASLMLYLSLNTNLEEDYLNKAEDYLFKVYFDLKLKKMEKKERFLFLQKELKRLHEEQIF